MKIIFCVIINGLLMLNVATGQSTAFMDQLREASKIIDDSIRLHKYDQILENHGVKEMSVNVDKDPVNEIETKWIVETNINPIDDSKRIIFSLVADEGVSGYRDPVVLLIRYDSKKTQLFIGWSDYLGSEASVTMRIGKEKAETFLWNMSTDKTATFYPKNCVNLIRKIVQVDTVVFRCTPYNESPVTAIFDVRGLTVLADEYMDDLKWW